jgi:hypothetical protein
VLGKLGIHMQKTEARSLLSPYTKPTQSRPKTLMSDLKLLEVSIGRTLQCIVIGNHFLNRSPTAQEIIARIDKSDCTKLKSFCVAKTCLGENLCHLFICQRINIKTIKRTQKMKSWKNNLTNKWANELNRHFPNEV